MADKHAHETDEKALKMIEKTKEWRSVFNLPITEYLIQDYTCGYWRGLPYGWWQGKLCICNNHILFKGVVGSFQLDIKLREVESVQESRSLLVVNNGLQINFHEKKDPIHFGTFANIWHRDEALVLIRHLLNHPVSFVFDQDLEEEKPGGNVGRGKNTRSRPTSSMEKSSDIQAVKTKDLSGIVDVESSERALSAAYRARDTGAATLGEMSRQREVLHEAEKGLDDINHNVDMANRHMRGIESVGGAFLNKATTAPSKEHTAKAKEDLVMQEVDRYIDIRVIHKMSDDSLRFAILRCHKETFEILDGGKDETEDAKRAKGKNEWKYSDIVKLVVRSRPLHLDVRFKEFDRLRLCTAEIQTVVCELYYRARCEVIFEDGPMPRFSYNVDKKGLNYRINKNRDESFKAFRRSTQRREVVTAFTMSVEDDKTHEALKKQDENLDELEDVVLDLQDMGVTIGKAVDQDIQTINRINQKTDDSKHRVAETNKRVEKML